MFKFGDWSAWNWRGNRGFLVVTAASLALTAFLGFCGPKMFDAVRLFAALGYWFMWALVLALALCLYDVLGRDRLAELRRTPGLALLAVVAGLIMVVFRLAIGYEFRILADETNLLGTSFSFWLNQTAQNIIEGERFFRSYQVITQEIPTRPLLYPFLMSIAHSLVGFDGDNGFRVNMLAGFAALLALGGFAARLRGVGFGLLTMLLLGAFPLFATCSTSSGFETLNALMLILLAAQLWRFLARPTGPDAELLLLFGLAAANCRYESITTLVPIGVAILLRAKPLLAGGLSWRMALVPLLALPLIWQRLLSSALNAGDVGREPFGLLHLAKHLPAAFFYFLNVGSVRFATIGLVFLLAIVGFALAVRRAWKRRASDRTGLLYAVLVAMGTGFILLVQCAYYLGDMRLAFISRMGLSFVPLIAILAAEAIWTLVERWRLRSGAVVAWGVAFAMLVHGVSLASANEAGRALFLFREYARNLAFVKTRPLEGTMIISDRPSMYAAHGMSAVSFHWANKNYERLTTSLRRRLHQEVLVMQQIPYDGKPPTPALDARFELEPVWEYQNTDKAYVRLSRIKLAEAALGAWPLAAARRENGGKQPEKAPDGAPPSESTAANKPAGAKGTSMPSGHLPSAAANEAALPAAAPLPATKPTGAGGQKGGGQKTAPSSAPKSGKP